MKITNLAFPALLTGALLLPAIAGATLGGSVDSIKSDRKALSAAHRATTSGPGYTVEEIAYDGTTVREFVSPAGIVFGIAWVGYLHPDLTQLLGSYAGEYSTALKQGKRVRGLKRQRVTTDNVVVEKWGHMRALQGRAYAPALVPSGVNIDAIR
ncbi:DUF2844 domain-containing protein [Geomesophilobacter sediminis]|uniref:DUF2844 domain-containing protein n=1 Tax=Geomesophilobacter sediminis TaxID=2798584 RepID=A0A8J7M288_9BACT|nr:DUF2844 domain-containing protein [Geomesophilobacter sediminis]MBJ6727385.1 DUF2844 domain-containing protein [Geomesophilobacter sediminis]